MSFALPKNAFDSRVESRVFVVRFSPWFATRSVPSTAGWPGSADQGEEFARQRAERERERRGKISRAGELACFGDPALGFGKCQGGIFATVTCKISFPCTAVGVMHRCCAS